MCKSSLSRECLQCGTTFNPYRDHNLYCSPKCRRANSYRRHKEKWAERSREGHFKKKYGISTAERDAMFAAQDGKCAVCDTHMTLESHKLTSAHVDHCHETDDVHSLLCTRCNQGLGLLGENPVILAKAIQYLAETGKVPTR